MKFQNIKKYAYWSLLGIVKFSSKSGNTFYIILSNLEDSSQDSQYLNQPDFKVFISQIET